MCTLLQLPYGAHIVKCMFAVGTVTQIYSTMTCTLDSVIVIKMGHGLQLYH